MGLATVYGEGINAKPAPDVMINWKGNDSKITELNNEASPKAKEHCDGTTCNL